MEHRVKLVFSGVEPSEELQSSQQSICLPSQVLLSLDMMTHCQFVRVVLPGNTYCIGKLTAVENVSPLVSSVASPNFQIYPVLASLCVTAGTWNGSTHVGSLDNIKSLKKSMIHSVCVKVYLNSAQSVQYCKKRPGFFLKVIEGITSLYGVVSGCTLTCKQNKLAQIYGIDMLSFSSVNGICKKNNELKKIDLFSDLVGFKFSKDVSESYLIRNQCDCGWKRCKTDAELGRFHISNGHVTTCSVELSEQQVALCSHTSSTECVETVMPKEVAFLQNLHFKNCNFYLKGPLLLMNGLSGCGKRSLVHHVATSSSIPLFYVDCQLLKHDSYSGEASHVLADLPSERPCLVLLHRLDLLFHSQKKSQNLPSKVAHTLLKCKAMGATVIITALDRSTLPVDVVCTASEELSVGSSTLSYRRAVLQSLLSHSHLMDALQPSNGSQHDSTKDVEAVDAAATLNKRVHSTSSSQFNCNEAWREVSSTRTSVHANIRASNTSAQGTNGDMCLLASQLANITPGYVAKDLKDFISLIESKVQKLPAKQVTMETVTRAASEEAKRLKPAVLLNSELLGDRPQACALGGLQSLQHQLSYILGGAVSGGEDFDDIDLAPTRGILLYGPPGCGKTQLVCSLAASQGFSFFAVQPKHILSPYVGESEQKLMTVFQTARRTRPSIIFFDEIDGVFGDRNENESAASKRLVTELLQALDGASAYTDGSDLMDGLIVCGATNNPHRLDAALLRPGRFDRVIYVPPPNAAHRLEILQMKCRELVLEHPDVLAELAEQTQFFTGADLEGMVQEATTRSLLANSFTAAGAVFVTTAVLRHICDNTKPKVTPELLRMYEAFQSNSSAS